MRDPRPSGGVRPQSLDLDDESSDSEAAEQKAKKRANFSGSSARGDSSSRDGSVVHVGSDDDDDDDDDDIDDDAPRVTSKKVDGKLRRVYNYKLVGELLSLAGQEVRICGKHNGKLFCMGRAYVEHGYSPIGISDVAGMMFVTNIKPSQRFSKLSDQKKLELSKGYCVMHVAKDKYESVRTWNEVLTLTDPLTRGSGVYLWHQMLKPLN